SDCYTCHKPLQPLVGPSFAAIAKKYKGQPGTVDKLTGKVIKGGGGVWGHVPMTPHTQLSKEDVAEMVRYILGVK
ncbi:MAG: c-type cytochrome, partial [Ginsengibacter sp.]